MFTNKEINKVKLAVTTDCNMGCPYCMVKETGEYMDFQVAKKAVDILCNNPSRKNKILSIYGGEPLLNPDLLFQLIPYARKLFEKSGQYLDITICTNATLLSKDFIRLFHENDVRFILSLGGEKQDHDISRIYKNKHGSYDNVIRNIDILKKNFSSPDLGIAFVVTRDTVRNIYKNIQHIHKLGFNHLNFEFIIDEIPWTKQHFKYLIINLKKTFDYIFHEILRGNYIYINDINWAIKYGSKEDIKHKCDFNYSLEIYPDGGVSFSPFVMNSEDKKSFIIANIKKSEVYKFKECTYDSQKDICINCKRDYYNGYVDNRFNYGIVNECRLFYRRYCALYAHKILQEAKGNSQYDMYVRNVKEDICF